ncbi:MAG: hypothetical protein H8E35_10630 [Ardenticatenia bacterium]|nr:hypothetical protein [Ardenticatenia bacterium]
MFDTTTAKRELNRRAHRLTECTECGREAVRIIEFLDTTAGFGEYYSGVVAYCGYCRHSELVEFHIDQS